MESVAQTIAAKIRLVLLDEDGHAVVSELEIRPLRKHDVSLWAVLKQISAY